MTGGPARFTTNSTSSLLLGSAIHNQTHVFAYGALTHYGRPSQRRSTNTDLQLSGSRQRTNDDIPQPRTRNPCRVSHTDGLATSAFARHYSRNHCCFLFLRVLRCFTSPRSLHAPYVFRCGSPDHSRVWRGFPIRTPWDHSPVIDSPRLIADSYVLLRLLMPRHPPCALKNLTTKDQKR